MLSPAADTKLKGLKTELWKRMFLFNFSQLRRSYFPHFAF